MSCYKALLFILGVCLSICLLTYLTMILFPKIRAPKEKEYYRAAVVEVAPFNDFSLPISEVVQRNLETYALAAKVAGSNGVDIIVFPESVLYANVDVYADDRKPLIGSYAENIPNPEHNDYNPCEQERKFRRHPLLRNLSCLAQENKLYLVANLVDYKKCQDDCGYDDENATSNCSEDNECPLDDMYFYNTNVVFNKAGKLIARYHKKHLFFEPTVNPSMCPEDGYFETEFGNFTTIICFDMLYRDAVEAIERTHASNLVYPNFWYDYTPYLYFANIFPQSFAIYNKINVLSANTHRPGSGSLGSGIYSASSGALIYTYKPDGHTKLLITNAPIHPKEITVNLDALDRVRYILDNETFSKEEVEEEVILENECEIKVVGPPEDITKDLRCASGNLTDYEFVKIENSEGNVTACSNLFCCSFLYKAKSMEEEFFLAVSATVFKLLDTFAYGIQSCFISRCKSEDDKTCTSFVLHSNTVFESAELKGNFTTKYVYPSIVNSNLRLAKKEEWTFDGKSKLQYQSLNNNSTLLFLGLHGRVYTEDYVF